MEKTRKLGQTDIEITAIGYGCMGQTHAYGVVEAEEDMVALMRYAHETGYTFFDTAPVYGEANEQYLGKAVAPFRKEVVVATKFGIVDDSFFSGNADALNSSRDSVKQQVDDSLKRLGTDYIDLYYLHRIDPKTEPEEVAEAFSALKKAGKVRCFGVSNHNPMQMELLNSCLEEPLCVNQIQFSVFSSLNTDSFLFHPYK